jgi:hypothetical protein
MNGKASRVGLALFGRVVAAGGLGCSSTTLATGTRTSPAIGRPAAAFGARGRGVLAFIDSSEAGFEGVVVLADCVTGA